jgi:DNA-binding NtrC family response regulator
MTGEHILVVDDEQSMTEFISILLGKDGYRVVTANSGQEAIEKAADIRIDCVITDIKMPGIDGISVLEGIKRIDPSIPVIIMTAYASRQSAIDAVNKGAFQYLEKSANNDEIKSAVKNALRMRRVQSENQFLKRQLKRTHEERPIIGKSEEMMAVFKMVDKVAETDSTILIYGESGTGKELIAREIHYRSKRASGPFVSINCGALPKDLLESNLFGHTKGSFTGAIRDQEGMLKVAEGGSFFLDEVGETSPATQVKLLRALQEREIIPVGGTKPIKIDVRLVAATNADLEKQVAEGQFRADLYYRLNVIPIRLPSLRERRDDIPLLVDHFLRKCCGETLKTASREAMDLLMKYDWPGNVRELENIIERAVILDEGGVIGADDLPIKIRTGGIRRGSLVIDSPSLTLEELEREYILKVLNHTRWHKKRASEILGINASTLYRKLQAYQMEGKVSGERAADVERLRPDADGGDEEEREAA